MQAQKNWCNNKNDKLQIIPLKFRDDWILHSKVLEFGFYPPEVW